MLARYDDRVWYEAVAEGPVAGGALLVRFGGFEDDEPSSIPAAVSHLAPLDCGGEDADVEATAGVEAGGSDSEGELHDAWAVPPRQGEGSDEEAFFAERVLGERGDPARTATSGDGTGPPSGVYVFGDWEQHTKGFGSRMLSRMGYRRGEGLGKEKQVKRSWSNSPHQVFVCARKGEPDRSAQGKQAPSSITGHPAECVWSTWSRTRCFGRSERLCFCVRVPPSIGVVVHSKPCSRPRW